MGAKATVMTPRRFELLRGQYEWEERTDSFECYSLKAQAGITWDILLKRLNEFNLQGFSLTEAINALQKPPEMV